MIALLITGLCVVLALIVLAAWGAPSGGSWSAWRARRKRPAFDYGPDDPRRERVVFTDGAGNALPVRIDLIDRAGTRYLYSRAGFDTWEALYPAAREAAAKLHGTTHVYVEDDPEQVLA